MWQKFESFILGLENALALGFHNILIFWDSELIIKLVKRHDSPSNKLMRRYVVLVFEMIEKFSDFNITHIIVDHLTAYSPRPNRHLILDKPDCHVVLVYHPHISNIFEPWQR